MSRVRALQARLTESDSLVVRAAVIVVVIAVHLLLLPVMVVGGGLAWLWCRWTP